MRNIQNSPRFSQLLTSSLLAALVAVLALASPTPAHAQTASPAQTAMSAGF